MYQLNSDDTVVGITCDLSNTTYSNIRIQHSNPNQHNKSCLIDRNERDHAILEYIHKSSLNEHQK